MGNEIIINILMSVITGIVASTLVVIFFEWNTRRARKVSRMHITSRFISLLFEVLELVSQVTKLSERSLEGRGRVYAEKLERLLRQDGTNNAFINVGNALLSMNEKELQYLLDGLFNIKSRLSLLSINALSHKSFDETTCIAIFEQEKWIDVVLENGNGFQSGNQVWVTVAHTTISNLIENTFSILKLMLDEHEKLIEKNSGLLMWGSRKSAGKRSGFFTNQR